MSDCAKCEGTGWIVVEREGVSGAERCDCVSVVRSVQLEESAGIPPLYRKASFDNFELPKGNPVARKPLARAMTMVSAWVRDFPADKRPGLLLIGDQGTGKTHLAVAALRALLAKGHEGIFFDFQNLLDRIRSSYDSASGSSDREAYRFALDTEVLLLDDLGAHRVTDWVEDIVTSIVTYRCNHCKPLIATTNLPDPEASGAPVDRPREAGKLEYHTTLAERIGARARSRLFEMCTVVQVNATSDYRIEKKRVV